jgi:hypothetical protein
MRRAESRRVRRRESTAVRRLPDINGGPKIFSAIGCEEIPLGGGSSTPSMIPWRLVAVATRSLTALPRLVPLRDCPLFWAERDWQPNASKRRVILPFPIAARRAWRRAADGLSRPLAAKRRRARAGFDGTVAAGPAQSLRAASRDTGDSSSGVLEICSGKTVPFEIAEMSIHSLADDTSHFRSTGTPPLRIEPDHPCLHDQTPRPKAACGIPLPPSLPALLRKRGNDLRTPAAGIEAACSPSLTAAHRSRSRTYPAGKVKG